MHSRLLAITCLVLALSLLAQPPAHADGCFVWRNRDVDIREPAQKAFILHEDGVEELVLSVRYSGAVEGFGWLVPLPARPEMKAVDAQVFETLSMGMQSPFMGHPGRSIA
jgi:hypothetical protein